MNIAHPYGFDGRGRTAEPTHDGHLRDLIEQLLLTAPGERVMRPDFGSGLAQLLFEPMSAELAATSQMVIHGAIDRYLGDVLAADSIGVEADDAAVLVTVVYRELATGEAHAASFSLQAAPL